MSNHRCCYNFKIVFNLVSVRVSTDGSRFLWKTKKDLIILWIWSFQMAVSFQKWVPGNKLMYSGRAVNTLNS